MFYIKHDKKGKITGYRTLDASETDLLEIYSSTELLVESDVLPDKDCYVRGNQVIPRPKMPLSITDTTISGVPEGASLKLGDQSFIVDDGVAEISGYHGPVKITCWPYLDEDVEI